MNIPSSQNDDDGRKPEPKKTQTRDGVAKESAQEDTSMTGREAHLMEQIDRNLQRLYRDTLQEPIPDRFLNLIAELRDKLKPNDR